MFEEARDLGFNPTLLDIGGGFHGSNDSALEEMAEVVNESLEEYFPEGCGVKVRARSFFYSSS